MFWETGKCSYFITPTLADFSSVLRNAVNLTLAISLIIQCYTLYLRNPGRATHSTNKNQGKNVNRSSLVRDF
jgi:hypothetical protein